MFGNLFKRRQEKRVIPHGLARWFAAAEVSRTLGAWKWDGGFSNEEIGACLAPMRARSRDMHKNNGDFKKYLSLVQANVVGAEGFRLHATPVKKAGVPVVDTKAAFIVEYHFARWAANKKWVDVTGRKSFPALCRLAALNWARDGECFIMLDTQHPANPYGIALRIVRPDACPEWYNGTTDGGNWIRNGVEVEPYTYKPVAYYFNSREEDKTVAVMHGGAVNHLRRVAADTVLHLYTQADECQVRGVPLTHAGLKPGKMLEQFNEAELIAARDEANTLGIFHAPLGREGEIAALNEDPESVGKLTQDSRPGQKLVLPEGWDYKSETPQHPNREITPFKASMKRDLANALDVEYANFANDWGGVNYSSVRAGTLAERDHWMTMQDDFIDQVCKPVFEAWLASWLRMAASGEYGAQDYERLAEYEFRARRWSWVDPMKDVNAAAVAVSHGWKTDQQVAAEYGCDIDDNLVEAARVAKLREQLGITGQSPDDNTQPPAGGKEENDE